MKKLFIFSLLFASCQKEDIQPTAPIDQPIVNTGTSSFNLDGTSYTSISNTIQVTTNPNGTYHLSVLFSNETGNTESRKNVALSTDSFEFSVKNYEVDNFYNTSNSNYISVSMGVNSASVYNSIKNDASFQNGTNYGEIGYFNITSINTVNKTMSGNYSMDVSKSSTEHIHVNGSFENITYVF